MKRSTINILIREAEIFFQEQSFPLPAFSKFTSDDWGSLAPYTSCKEIIDCGLGWDITDFGSNDFSHRGLLLFTLRNGLANHPQYAKSYAEKIMMVREEQYTPMHFHWKKSEDIINRGGGNLLFNCYASDEDESLAQRAFTLSIDGIKRDISPGELIRLHPGESLTLTPGIYHTFYAEKGSGTVLAGEVSSVNDDMSDNRFEPPCGRFPSIEEDVEPYRLLVSDYHTFFAPFRHGHTAKGA